MQDVIIMQAGKFPKIDKHAGCNKAMQVGIFQKIYSKIFNLSGKYPKINKRAGCNKSMQAGKF